MSAVEQGRGWGGTWMAGCTWWVVGWVGRRPLPSPPPEQAPGEGGRASPCDGSQPHGYCQVWCGCAPPPAPLQHLERGARAGPPVVSPRGGGTGATCCAPMALVGVGLDFRWRGNDAVVWWVCGWVRVRGLAGVWGKPSWRSRCWPAGKDDGGNTPRHADGADPAPRPWWPGVRRHPVPSWRHADGQAAPCTRRRGVAPDPVPDGRHADGADPAPRP